LTVILTRQTCQDAAFALAAWCIFCPWWLGRLAKSCVMRPRHKLDSLKSVGFVGDVYETDAPQLAYHYQVLERFVVRFLYFVCNLLNRLGLFRASKYLDNLSVRFCGIILDIHCRKYFGISWSEKRASFTVNI
jgi:hypothetical protein